MSVLVFTLIVLAGSFVAGLLGSLTGLGGGMIIIPLLALVFGVDMHYAIGTSLIAVIATSSGAAAAYVREGITNIRLGMFLEIATTIGALVGALISTYMPTNAIAIIFGITLIYSALMSLKKHEEHQPDVQEGSIAKKLKLAGDYPTAKGRISYVVQHVPGGSLIMVGAGMLSGLLGIGSGAFKVLAMDKVMRIPFKVSTTTSNFMIGVTAAASTVVYFQKGYIDPGFCFPVVLGVLGGAMLGSRILIGSGSSRMLRIVFSIAVSIIAVEMIYNGLKGNL